MALIDCLGPSASRRRFHPVEGADQQQIARRLHSHLPLKVKKTKKAKSSFLLVELLIWSKKQKWS